MNAGLEDQLQLFAVQNRRQQRLLGKVDYVVTDSPILLNSWYYTYNTPNPLSSLLQLMDDIWNTYDNINILIEREHKFETIGRVHDEQQSHEIQDGIVDMLYQKHIPYIIWKSGNVNIECLANNIINWPNCFR